MYTGERRPTSVSDIPMPVQITDVNIRFFSLMWLLVKLSFAAIPAAFIITVIWVLAVGFLGGVLRVLGH
jgi:hypothetical protein